ncbi:PREDICTED: mitogen-activated protein kinase kinase kinase ANP1-like [Tarenaya hassleriana]|uniref:mitogen-activated protein kinase kinase kinase ANP1-like n=1 Tax=Tarenaya hassleriana TaxID=28532 RepID=UPI00053C184F|nr:PREDICTED: mitogen-activated protein kinase kinase kinase ANP1-like [Tarenaya hassleriana]
MMKKSPSSSTLDSPSGSLGSLNPPKKIKHDAKWMAMMERRRHFMGPAKKKKIERDAKWKAMMERRRYFMGPTKTKKTAKNRPTKPRNSHDGASWVRSEFLGQGSFGSVYLAVRDNGDKMAVKTAEMSRASTLMDESRILSLLYSRFVVSFLGDEITTDSETGEKHYNIMLEFCSGRSLKDLIGTQPEGIRESHVKLLATDILRGLNDIHCRRIIHCDIKPANILLVPQVKWNRPDWFVAKIADFGLAVEKDTVEYDEDNGYPRGTAMYMSPELVTGGDLDYGADVWAFGCTVLEMLTGSHAWGEENARLNRDELMRMIANSDEIPVIPESVSDKARDFLEKCLVRDPDLRWTTDALLAHPFLHQPESP